LCPTWIEELAMSDEAIVRGRGRQRGQTLWLVAICLVVLVSMAALAIDLTTLYVARGQVQRTADAAALAGAKAFVDSGVTTAPSAGNQQTTLASNLAAAYINTVLVQNKVSGVSPTLVGTPTIIYPSGQPGDPQITVTVQRTNLPTFFARIFGQRLATVSATATAEAYNPSNPGGAGNNTMPPVAPSCVKPWVVPNKDPRHGGDEFVDHTNGAVKHPGVWGGTPDGVIGETITLINDCDTGRPNCNPPVRLPPTIGGGGHPTDGLDYLPAQLLNAASSCSTCGGSNYERSSACCDAVNTYTCGGTTPGLVLDLANNTLTDTISGVECLIGATNPGPAQGQDEIDTGNFLASNGRDPIEITGGGSNPHDLDLVSTSNSIVTLPIYDSSGALPGIVGNLIGPLNIIGFMQAFVQQTNSPDADVLITVLNISGCGTNVNTSLTAISGGGVSPIPVRLIHN
jgi:Putative Flp pilus-assembly TadE/G-like